MSCKDDFFEGSLSHISTWEVDRILYTVSSMNSKYVKKRRISDEEIDKILSEEFIPITRKEINKSNVISGELDKKSPDITVIKAKRQKTASSDRKNADKAREKEVTKEIERIISDSNEKNIINDNPAPPKRKKKKTSLLVPVLSFICLALCVILCMTLISASSL